MLRVRTLNTADSMLRVSGSDNTADGTLRVSRSGNIADSM